MKGSHATKRARHRMCGSKVRYRDHTEAVTMIQKAERRRGTPLRAYDCDLCHGFHLTRIAPRRTAAQKEDV